MARSLRIAGTIVNLPAAVEPVKEEKPKRGRKPAVKAETEAAE